MSAPTPKVSLVWSQQGTSFRAMATPDTGTTLTVMSTSYMHKLFTTASTWRLTAADGRQIDSSREATLRVARPGCPSKEITVLLCSDLPAGEILLAWSDQIKLGILHPEWPNPPTPASATPAAPPPPNSVASLFQEFPEVLDDDLTADKRMKGDPLKVRFKEGPVTPFHANNARPVPAHLEAPGRALCDDLVRKGVLRKLDENTVTDWLSRGHFVPKPGRPAQARLVTDYVKLNAFIRRPIHPFPSADAICKMVKGTDKWFCKLDAVHGYFQLPLDPESQLLTAFLLPWGRYAYTVAPMALSPSGDWFCKRTDEALAGLDGVVKLVDDILVAAPTEDELYRRVRSVLNRCHSHGITISRKKLTIGQSVEFAGHIVDSDGVRPTTDKVAAIKDFPRPHDVPSLRSFMGMCNQLMSFVPDLSHAMRAMRVLLQKSRAWDWTDAMEKEFTELKELLSGLLLVRHYNPDLPSTLITDASGEGLGYLLTQKQPDGTVGIVTCGSRSATSTESRYAPIELEALGVAYAVGKCEYFLRGNPHTTTVLTDHRPLEGIFRKDLADVSNTRVQRIREKLVGIDLKVKFVPGKDNVVADALSRAPLFPPPTQGEEVAHVRALHIPAVQLGVNLSSITDGIDDSYSAPGTQRGAPLALRTPSTTTSAGGTTSAPWSWSPRTRSWCSAATR